MIGIICSQLIYVDINIKLQQNNTLLIDLLPPPKLTMSNNGPAVDGPQPKPGKYLKVSLFLRKLPNVSDEYFHGYWRNNHLVPAFANETFMSKVRKYNQVSFVSARVA